MAGPINMAVVRRSQRRKMRTLFVFCLFVAVTYKFIPSIFATNPISLNS